MKRKPISLLESYFASRKETQEKALHTAQEIAGVLRKVNSDWTLSEILQQVYTEFAEGAENADSNYGDKYDDGGSDFTVGWEQTIARGVDIEVNGTGYGIRAAGWPGSYDSPADPDYTDYGIKSVTLYIVGNGIDEKWDIEDLLDDETWQIIKRQNL